MSIYLGNGKGGFSPPVTYDAGPEPTGLTIADINHDGNPDLLVGNPYGDVLVLLGQGDGTFQPYHKADQAVALAVADLTGDGSPGRHLRQPGARSRGRRLRRRPEATCWAIAPPACSPPAPSSWPT